MNSDETLDLTFDDVDFEGNATATAGGMRVAVAGGIPGERSRVRVARGRDGARRPTWLEVLRPSASRVEPRCRHAAECGGCAWQHIAYPEQLRLKQRLLETLLGKPLGGRAPDVLPVAGTPAGEDGMPWSYRQKVSFVFGAGPGGRGLRMGHFARGTSRVIHVDECPVHSERGNLVAFALRDRLARASIPAAGPALDGVLRHLIVRATADGSETAAMLVVTRNDKRLRGPVRALLSSADAPESFLVNEHDQPGPYMTGRRTTRIAGAGRVRERRLGPAYLVSPDAFFQTNVEAARVLVDLVTEAAGDGVSSRILDLYCGSGLFSLPLAIRGHTVTGVEENRQAISDAQNNVRVNRVPAGRLRFMAARVQDALPRLAGGNFDLVVLDPPRQGCPPSVLSAVFEHLAPARAVYVSCNPEALASELPRIVKAGYRIDRVQPVDMFPHTPHIETVVIMSKRQGDSPLTARGQSS